jgi:hypothetical protein
MVVDEHRGSELTPQQALAQIGYLKDLVQETRISVAAGWQSFVVWGVVWIIGYAAVALAATDLPFAPPESALGGIWFGLIALVYMTSAISRRRTKNAPATTLGRRLLRLNLALLVVAFVLLPFVLVGDLNLPFSSAAYIPLWVGVAYVVNGLFVGNELTAVGAWILGATVITRFLDPLWAQALWLAVAGGGGLVVTGLIFRKVMARSRVA